jgi:arginase
LNAFAFLLAGRMFNRRDVQRMIGATVLVGASSMALTKAQEPRRVLVAAPSNLGLRPLRRGHVPGAWRGPAALERAGLAKALRVDEVIRLARPDYSLEEPKGSRIRNGPELRRFNERLSEVVRSALRRRGFPIVVGGDCSILLGCLAGTRALGEVGLIHVDGHSDFSHPGNYDTSSRLGSAAGMDLALATGRGEPLLASWQGKPLVRDRNVVQIGERDELDPDYAYRDIEETLIGRLPARAVQSAGIRATVERALAMLPSSALPLWLHVDLDVVDGSVLPAVDSPGSPGLSYDELAELLGRLLSARRLIGLDVSIYDPDLDPSGRHADAIVRCLEAAFSWE